MEIVKYIESANNQAGDSKLALTKVNLIKQRLRAWGAAMPVDMPPNPQATTPPLLPAAGY